MFTFGQTAPDDKRGIPGDVYLQADGRFFERVGEFPVSDKWQFKGMLIPPAGLVAFTGPIVAGPKGDRGFPGPPGPSVPVVGAEVVLTSTQAISDSTTTAISWTSATTDDFAFWSSGAPTRLTIRRAGWYELTNHTKWAANNNGKRVMDFRFNGSIFRGSQSQGNFAGGVYNDPDMAAPVKRYLVIGDYVEVTVYQNSTGSLNVTAAECQILGL